MHAVHILYTRRAHFDLDQPESDREPGRFESKQSPFEVESPDFNAELPDFRSKRRRFNCKSADFVLKWGRLEAKSAS